MEEKKMEREIKKIIIAVNQVGECPHCKNGVACTINDGIIDCPTCNEPLECIMDETTGKIILKDAPPAY